MESLDAIEIETLRAVETRVLWLAASIVEHANLIRPEHSGVKVGGHQASSASMVSIMTALYFRHLRADDLVSVKPHAFLELARRHGDYAVSGVAAALTLDAAGAVTRARIALIGVGDRAVRARSAEAELVGQPVTRPALAAAADAVDVDIDPLPDIHATAGYRRQIARVLTRRALECAADRAAGKRSS